MPSLKALINCLTNYGNNSPLSITNNYCIDLVKLEAFTLGGEGSLSHLMGIENKSKNCMFQLQIGAAHCLNIKKWKLLTNWRGMG